MASTVHCVQATMPKCVCKTNLGKSGKIVRNAKSVAVKMKRKYAKEMQLQNFNRISRTALLHRATLATPKVHKQNWINISLILYCYKNSDTKLFGWWLLPGVVSSCCSFHSNGYGFDGLLWSTLKRENNANEKEIGKMMTAKILKLFPTDKAWD